jgi:hypothetical protein
LKIAKAQTFAEARAALGVLQAYCLTNEDLPENENIGLGMLDEAIEKILLILYIRYYVYYEHLLTTG